MTKEQFEAKLDEDNEQAKFDAHIAVFEENMKKSGMTAKKAGANIDYQLDESDFEGIGPRVKVNCKQGVRLEGRKRVAYFIDKKSYESDGTKKLKKSDLEKWGDQEGVFIPSVGGEPMPPNATEIFETQYRDADKTMLLADTNRAVFGAEETAGHFANATANTKVKFQQKKAPLEDGTIGLSMRPAAKKSAEGMNPMTGFFDGLGSSDEEVETKRKAAKTRKVITDKGKLPKDPNESIPQRQPKAKDSDTKKRKTAGEVQTQEIMTSEKSIMDCTHFFSKLESSMVQHLTRASCEGIKKKVTDRLTPKLQAIYSEGYDITDPAADKHEGIAILEKLKNYQAKLNEVAPFVASIGEAKSGEEIMVAYSSFKRKGLSAHDYTIKYMALNMALKSRMDQEAFEAYFACLIGTKAGAAPTQPEDNVNVDSLGLYSVGDQAAEERLQFSEKHTFKIIAKLLSTPQKIIEVARALSVLKDAGFGYFVSDLHVVELQHVSTLAIDPSSVSSSVLQTSMDFFKKAEGPNYPKLQKSVTCLPTGSGWTRNVASAKGAVAYNINYKLTGSHTLKIIIQCCVYIIIIIIINYYYIMLHMFRHRL